MAEKWEHQIVIVSRDTRNKLRTLGPNGLVIENETGSRESLLDRLNRWGNDGWYLVSIEKSDVGTSYWMRRQVS